eukprot:CAMPEP_0167773470 /NCGR_PEP_ID=MMETSP0111_2-20121227/1436_1 /TAXON_ID=91324 /ORGANISM="Lotharella globosa, Strain CCCM811" /LENGTH=124 /DNA_ID=CAMNT_0007663107 /DNA_START=379 /DNA_END=750 /DNA_ORIENTATION=+
MIIPNEYTSDSKSIVRERRSSGAIYLAPTNTPWGVLWGEAGVTNLLRPKSAILQEPNALKRMFAGFRSPCATGGLHVCKKANAREISKQIFQFSEVVIPFLFSRYCFRVPPGMCSSSNINPRSW